MKESPTLYEKKRRKSNRGRGLVAIQENLTVGAGGVLVKGNVEGNIQILNKRLEVNADHGAVVNVYDEQPRVKKRGMAPHAPRPVRGFVNRTGELKRLEQVIAARAAAAIQGMNGMGKSALLRQAANRSVSRALPDGVLFMDGIDEQGQALAMEDVIQRLFDKIFESEPHLKVNFDVAQTYLSNLKSLLILNGLDLPGSSISRLPDLFPQGAVLIESRKSMDNEIIEGISLGILPRSEAIELLAARAGTPPGDETRPLLDAICGILADVPLAIVIAGNAIRENNLALREAHALLAQIKPQRTEPIRSGIERAYLLAESTLSELERQWLAAAALAPGVSIAPGFLNQLAGDDAEAARAQEHLQVMGLLTANSPRLRIDPAVRDLARRNAEDYSLLERFSDYLKSTLKTRSLDWEYCTEELGNILGMIGWAASQQRFSDVIVLGRAIDPFLTLHGLWESWRAVIESTYRSARGLGDRANEAWALHQMGTHALGVGSLNPAIEYLRQALELRSELGDVIGMAYTRHNLDLLLPPPSSSNDNGGRPGNPPTSGRTLRLLLKVIGISTLVLVGGFFAVSALLTLVPAPTPAPTFIIPVAGASKTPAATWTPTSTRTSTVTSTKTPTKTPTNTLTATFTPSPTINPSNIGGPQLSTYQLYYGRSRCDPSRVTISVPASHPAGIRVVVFFHRMHDSRTGDDSGWSDGLSMNTRGDGVYILSVSGDTLIGNSGFTSEVRTSYQFVIQAQNGELTRSTVFSDLFLLPCGSRPNPEPITITETPQTITPEPIE